MASIPLSEMIQTLRQELSESMKAGADSKLKFAVDAIELQLQMTLTREGTAGGKVKFWVVDLEAGGKLARADVHTFKLTLKPSFEGGPVTTAVESPRRPE